MSHKPFQFKQFKVYQDKAAMKVGTDGVLLGAWTELANEKTILDVGCGTGVIALMLAQRSQADITAIDIDSDAFQQASENFKNSKWTDQLLAKHTSLQDFEAESDQYFDLIVSNPPYFEANTNTTSRTTARNQNKLDYESLIYSSKNLLTECGRMRLVIPSEHLNYLTNLSFEMGLYTNNVCLVRGKMKGTIKRALVEFSFKEENPIESELNIELENRHQYSREYKDLMKDYLIIF